MSTDKLKQYQAEVAHAMKVAAEEYIEANPPEKVAKDTLKFLKKSAKDIQHTLLGFEVDRWGKGHFEVDHCNGRSGESAVGDYLREHKREAIKEWLDTAKLAPLDEGAIASMNREFQQVYRDYIQKLVKAEAEALASRHLEELKSQDALQELYQMETLLNG